MTMTQEEIDALISGGGIEDMNDDNDAFESAMNNASTTKSPNYPEIDFQSSNSGYSPIDPKLELLYDLQLPVSIELGRTNMLIREILRLGRGSVIEFDKLVSEPVDVLINGKKVAEGEVVVIDKHFGIRITTLVDPAERLRGMRR